MPSKTQGSRAAKTRLSSVSEGMSKNAQRIAAAVCQLQKTRKIDTRQQQSETFCAMMSTIRDDPEACELAESDPVAYMGKYVNDQARSGDVFDLCALVKELRTVDTANLSTIQAFYMGMITHAANGRERRSTDLPDKDLGCKLRLLRVLEEETRARVSASAADEMHRYVKVVAADVEFATTLNKTK